MIDQNTIILGGTTQSNISVTAGEKTKFNPQVVFARNDEMPAYELVDRSGTAFKTKEIADQFAAYPSFQNLIKQEKISAFFCNSYSAPPKQELDRLVKAIEGVEEEMSAHTGITKSDLLKLSSDYRKMPKFKRGLAMYGLYALFHLLWPTFLNDNIRKDDIPSGRLIPATFLKTEIQKLEPIIYSAQTGVYMYSGFSTQSG